MNGVKQKDVETGCHDRGGEKETRENINAGHSQYYYAIYSFFT